VVKRLVSGFLVCLFLVSSFILPLGDFSLMRDIPNMYRNYTKITTDEELGVLDFVGDYLMHGKELFGNNAHDKPQTNTNNVQFQHQANPLLAEIPLIVFRLVNLPQNRAAQPISNILQATTDYQNECFRPPLA
jgi:hypothetical protein